MIWFCVVLVALQVSCRHEERPPGIASHEEMTRLMIEMYLSESHMMQYPIGRDSALKLFYPHEQSLLHASGMTDSSLKASYQYYLDRPIELEQILDAVIDSLNLREQKLTDKR